MMALSDIKVKQEQMRKNRDFLASKYALPLDSSLQYLVRKEINLGLQDLDGSNNAKKLQKSDKCNWKWNYKTYIIYGKSILDQIDMEIINMEFPSHLRKVESIVREFRCCSSYELIFN